jgi:hypothetical protein
MPSGGDAGSTLEGVTLRAMEVFVALVGALAKRHPDCAFESWSGGSLDHLAALAERKADVIVAADSDEETPWLERHVLLREPFVLVTAKGLVDPARNSRGHRSGETAARLTAAPLVRYTGRPVEPSHKPCDQSRNSLLDWA